jgi:hypothetical protein
MLHELIGQGNMAVVSLHTRQAIELRTGSCPPQLRNRRRHVGQISERLSAGAPRGARQRHVAARLLALANHQDRQFLSGRRFGGAATKPGRRRRGHRHTREDRASKEQGVVSIGGIQGDYEYIEFSRDQLEALAVKIIRLFDLSNNGLRR